MNFLKYSAENQVESQCNIVWINKVLCTYIIDPPLYCRQLFSSILKIHHQFVVALHTAELIGVNQI